MAVETHSGKAKKEAEADLRRREIALAQARAELAQAHAAEKIVLEARVLKLEGEVTEAQTREVQLTQAQLTRHGTVYIICNIGSFGEGVLKVGLTRRLDPDERVTELGDASVPFLFDVLAYIESDDAPALEARLHKVLEGRRVNLVNRRKEFFHATLAEVMAVVNADASASRKIRRFTPRVEAREFRQTELIRAERTGKPAARSVVDEARERFENMKAVRGLGEVRARRRPRRTRLARSHRSPHPRLRRLRVRFSDAVVFFSSLCRSWRGSDSDSADTSRACHLPRDGASSLR